MLRSVATRLFIVDDNASFLREARTLLERQGLQVAGTASSSAEALRRVSDVRPDAVLVDMVLGDENGVELARDLADRGSRVILISTQSLSDVEDLIVDSPALGFVPKTQLSADAILRLLDAAA
jgi:DNA-binding NarL/FixJ family response regulator